MITLAAESHSLTVSLYESYFRHSFAFWDIWMAFLESKGASLSGDQKAAWNALGATFNEECQSHLATLGLPHV
ncbi:hypothetical protein Y032_0044g995 [Ancylostoma ceylanicum]|uniref:Globin family profile domain-containing protein n=1 Tax=Ancylostoma ceylanicum TaxID=53326 RepID=A0A016UEV1_9BILA|nr:hypothetical protein Y032_0044g995 [Ancylostoma ceylanicum]